MLWFLVMTSAEESLPNPGCHFLPPSQLVADWRYDGCPDLALWIETKLAAILANDSPRPPGNRVDVRGVPSTKEAKRRGCPRRHVQRTAAAARAPRVAPGTIILPKARTTICIVPDSPNAELIR